MREEADVLTVGDMFNYLNDSELNPRNELLKDWDLLLKTHRDYISRLNHPEYQEYKRNRNAKLNQS